ncbi:hypothetical protein ACHHYP_07408 [Achlya hypogyna]|uniref:Uncharacterized protein n=1 Tax=Achlya hypogyna TaxID=1202772 RepID=A0A1V9ZMV3_ACHHY|nr:hypothetical protein ACHHYP_07408 [Achlya hypogyna]
MPVRRPLLLKPPHNTSFPTGSYICGFCQSLMYLGRPGAETFSMPTKSTQRHIDHIATTATGAPFVEEWIL